MLPAIAVAALLLGVAVNLIPEDRPEILTPRDGWVVSGHFGLVRIDEFPAQFRQVRASVSSLPDAILYRSWTPERGVEPIIVTSPPFSVPPHFAVAVTGTTRTPSGKNAAYLSCSTHAQTHPIFLGSVNVNVVEALVSVPLGWCQGGQGRIHLIAEDKDHNVGIGTAFTVSQWQRVQLSLVGQFPHLVVALGAVLVPVVGGIALALRFGLGSIALPFGFGVAGLFALLTFFGRALLPGSWGVAVTPTGYALMLLGFVWCGLQRTTAALTEVRPFAAAWLAGASTYFALMMTGNNGLGHWEPNYRFWPAVWSSDNELPWLFAEAIRHSIDLAGLYGGGWKPTDRPPLMVGFHLIVSDITTVLFSTNSFPHLRGAAYNTAAIALSSSWIPPALWLLVREFGIRFHRAIAAVVLLGMLPFSIFNSIYGWPKGLGAAFGLAATAVAFQMVRDEHHGAWVPAGTLFGTLSALSLLSHASNALFLLPIGVWLVITRLRHCPVALLLGVTVGLGLLFSWHVYQFFILPSEDPLIRYALVGDFGFNQPNKSVLAMLVERYASLDLPRWAAIKIRMMAQPFWPLSTELVTAGVNKDFGVVGLEGLRAWDFAVLSIGNCALVLSGLYAWIVRRRPLLQRVSSSTVTPEALLARQLVVLVVWTWVLLVLVFMAPLTLHHWPYTAVFALGIGGLGVLVEYAPRMFRYVALATTLYVGIVWIISPLRTLVQIDWIAFIVFTLLAIRLLRTLQVSSRISEFDGDRKWRRR